MSVNSFNHKWFRELRQLGPDERLTRVCVLAWFLTGFYASRSVQLHRVALPREPQLDTLEHLCHHESREPRTLQIEIANLLARGPY